MKEFRLSPRLYAIARAAESGRHIVDVGTDHGYIPVWLALRGQTERITATDIRPGPLERAMRSAEAHGVESRIRFVLCDGLSYDGASAADSVIIAGMGGETIISILAGAPWTKSGTRLILQPQTRHDELCVWLAGEGYPLDGAVLAEDAGRLYAIISAHGDGVSRRPVFIEDVLAENRDPLLPCWLDARIAVLQKAAGGLALARSGTDGLWVGGRLQRLQSIREGI